MPFQCTERFSCFHLHWGKQPFLIWMQSMFIQFKISIVFAVVHDMHNSLCWALEPQFPSGQYVLLYSCEVISYSWQRTVTAVYDCACYWLIPCCVPIVRVNILIVVSLNDIHILLSRLCISKIKSTSVNNV